MSMLTKSTEDFISSFEWIMSRNLMIAIIEQFGSEREFIVQREEVAFHRDGLASFKGWDNTTDLMALYNANKKDIHAYANEAYQMDCHKSVEEMLKEEDLLPSSYDATSERSGQMAGILAALFPSIAAEPVSEEMACALTLLVGRRMLFRYSAWNEREQDIARETTKTQKPKYDGIENEIIKASDVVWL